MDRLKIRRAFELIGAYLRPAGLGCLDIQWDGSGRILRVFLEGETIGLDDCVQATQALQDVPELDELFTGSWNLEVSSPGVDRPLRRKEHFAEAVGEEIKVWLYEKSGGRKKARGRLLRVSDTGEVELSVDGESWGFSLENLKKAHLVYDWNQE